MEKEGVYKLNEELNHIIQIPRYMALICKHEKRSHDNLRTDKITKSRENHLLEITQLNKSNSIIT